MKHSFSYLLFQWRAKKLMCLLLYKNFRIICLDKHRDIHIWFIDQKTNKLLEEGSTLFVRNPVYENVFYAALSGLNIH